MNPIRWLKFVRRVNLFVNNKATDRWVPQMRHFYQDSQDNWRFKTVGKGNKKRDITVSETMLEALARYRHHRELTPTIPIAGDTTQLLHKLIGQGAVSSSRQIRALIQACFDQAVTRMTQEGFTSLEETTVHWLRHTDISDDINKRGHAPLLFMSEMRAELYNDVEQHARHLSGQKKSLYE